MWSSASPPIAAALRHSQPLPTPLHATFLHRVLFFFKPSEWGEEEEVVGVAGNKNGEAACM